MELTLYNGREETKKKIKTWAEVQEEIKLFAEKTGINKIEFVLNGSAIIKYEVKDLALE